MSRSVRRIVVAIGLVLLGGSLSGCIVEEGGHHHGWCYWHPC
jgi:hypothetical protein